MKDEGWPIPEWPRNTILKITINGEEPMLSTHDYVGGLNETQTKACEMIRAKFKELEALLKTLPDHGSKTASDRFIAISKTKLEEASMYAIKAVAFEGKEVG